MSIPSSRVMHAEPECKTGCFSKISKASVKDVVPVRESPAPMTWIDWEGSGGAPLYSNAIFKILDLFQVNEDRVRYNLASVQRLISG